VIRAADFRQMEETLLLLRFNCPYPDCAHMATDWPSLEKHTLATHGLVLCTLCRKQLSRFAHEQILYPPHLLPLHDPSRVARGQRPPRPRGEKEIELVKSWEAPHPMCEVGHADTQFRRFIGKVLTEVSSATRRSLVPMSSLRTCVASTKSVSYASSWARRTSSECSSISSGSRG
jgi:hypothetical protein